MPKFLRFPLGGDMLVNTAHLVSVQLAERTAEQKDVDNAGNLFQVGQTMYLVRLYLPGSCNEIDLQYPAEADRNAVYEEIAAALTPLVITPTSAKPRKPRAKPSTRKSRK